MTRQQFLAALRSEFQVTREQHFPSSTFWLDVSLKSGVVVTVEMTKNDIGVSVLDDGAAPFGGPDQAFVDPGEALEFIRAAARKPRANPKI